MIIIYKLIEDFGKHIAGKYYFSKTDKGILNLNEAYSEPFETETEALNAAKKWQEQMDLAW